MIELSPTQRLEWMMQQPHLASAHSTIERLLAGYEEFLRRTDKPEDQLVRLFMDKHESEALLKVGFDLGDTVLEALDAIGTGNRFRRFLIV